MPRSTRAVDFAQEYVCWTRMQAEAGQPLEAIVARKELERQVGGGVFLWGVGNAPAAIVSVLARAKLPVRTIFSVMKSRPKPVDTSPTRVVVWRRYIDVHGIERALPPHALVASRGDSAGGAKRVHYALMCRSNEPLVLNRGDSFDPGAFRNASANGAPVGASQVTALLRRVQDIDGPSGYEANLTAWLTDSYWVRLADPIEIGPEKRVLMERLATITPCQWQATVSAILEASADSVPPPAVDRLF